VAHFKTKLMLTLGLALIAAAASADTNINSSSIGEDARVYEITSTEPTATGPDIGPLEGRLLAASAAEMRVDAGDITLLRVAEGTPNRSPSGSALYTTTCDNGGFTVATFGELHPNVCGVLGSFPATPGTYRIVVIKPTSIDNFGGFFYQSGANWIQMVFAQTFKAPWGSSITLEKNEERYESTDADGTMTLRSPFLGPLMDSETKPRVWPIGNGVAASYRDGTREVLPPGLRIVTADGLCTQIKTFMDPFSVILLTAKGTPPPTAEKIAASFKEFGCLPKDRSVPIVGLLLLFGLPLAIVAGLIFGVRRFLRRRHGAVPATPTPAPTAVVAIPPADIPVGMRFADAATAVPATADAKSGAAAQPAEATPDTRPPIDRLRAWRALEARQRYRIIGGAAVLLLFLLFVILRPSSDPATILRKLASDAKSGAASSELGKVLGEETLTGELPSEGAFVSPAAGHTARFAWYRPGDAKVIFDIFSSPSDAEQVLTNIRAGGPEEELLLPAVARGAATGFAHRSVVAFKPQMVFECRSAAYYLYCMTQPANMALLLTVRVPADTVIPIPGVADAKTHAETEARYAIDLLHDVGIGNR
jgi:hypothetical protein